MQLLQDTQQSKQKHQLCCPGCYLLDFIQGGPKPPWFRMKEIHQRTHTVLFLHKTRVAMAICVRFLFLRKFSVFRFCLDFEACAKGSWQQETLSPSRRSLCNCQHLMVLSEDEGMLCVFVQANFVHSVVILYRVTRPSPTPARSTEPCRKHITINRVTPKTLSYWNSWHFNDTA